MCYTFVVHIRLTCGQWLKSVVLFGTPYDTRGGNGMKHSNKRLTALLMTALMVTAVVSGCSGGTNSSAGNTTSAVSDTAQENGTTQENDTTQESQPAGTDTDSEEPYW